MAAGMGSRFGGLKQATAITESGKGILDFSFYDAKKAGFSDAVVILRQDIQEEFKNRIGHRLEQVLPVTYVLQDTSSLPEGRKKPFGTAHAILCCKDAVHNPFLAINADDYYGAHAFNEIEKFLEKASPSHYAMVAYELGKTLSKNGTVTRGVCAIQDGFLSRVEECYGIHDDGSCLFEGKETRLPMETPVSMNLWGLTPDFFDLLEAKWALFQKTADLEKDEFLLPSVIGEAIAEKKATVKVFHNSDAWTGMTYKEDLPTVKANIQKLVDEGFYPGF